jgi:hypothetical protein
MEQALTVNEDSPLDIADSILPAFDGMSDKKREYLSYRLCGFGRLETCKIVDLHVRTVNNWCLEDPEFKKIEKTNLLELRKQFSKHIALFEFTRNFRLVLDIDTRVINKVRARGMVGLTKEEREYFIKMRGMYTPQQFQVLEDLFQGKSSSVVLNWAVFIKEGSDAEAETTTTTATVNK